MSLHGLFRVLAVTFLVAALVSMIVAAFPGSIHAASLKIGDRAPRVSLPDREGRSVLIPDDLSGKVVVIHFWADTCPYCLEEMPALERIFQEYKGSGLVVVAVNVGQSSDRVNAYVERVEVTYPVLLDQEMTAARAYRVGALPRTFMLDRKGNIRYKILGDATEDTLRKLIRKLM